ncbi:hypothetical protein [Pontibacter anaerobius]|uniref:Uncharacterized protein n=1 Tax=Pontibacter anaerobius TaxID=2993940 RepID=A0ABT3R9C6_9BACT|nr:hypothetical protein [Pontibacter anaerobius]MCX2738338.1 hypothetical protein [Pontibacter anaerobius]
MKAFRLLLTMAVAVVLMVGMSSCNKCDNENPRARVINHGSLVASVQIKTSNGNTENINNVMPNTSSDTRSYAKGLVTFTITLDKTELVETVQMDSCYEYDIVIDANNSISTVSRDLND